MAEIDIIALQAEGDDAGDNDRAEHDAGDTRLQQQSQFLDGEHHSGQRRVESRGNARGGAGQHQPAFQPDIGQAQQPAKRMHDGRANLRGGAFPADRGAGAKAEKGEQKLPDRDPR